MRTRTCPTSPHASAANDRWASTADASASAGSAKAAQNASPTVLKTNPPCASIALWSSRSCVMSAPLIAAGSASQRFVLPSMSVKRSVTTPEGAEIAVIVTPKRGAPARSFNPGSREWSVPVILTSYYHPPRIANEDGQYRSGLRPSRNGGPVLGTAARGSAPPDPRQPADGGRRILGYKA